MCTHKLSLHFIGISVFTFYEQYTLSSIPNIDILVEKILKINLNLEFRKIMI